MNESSSERALTAKVAMPKLQYFGHVAVGSDGRLEPIVLKRSTKEKLFQWLDNINQWMWKNYLQLKMMADGRNSRRMKWSSADIPPLTGYNCLSTNDLLKFKNVY